MDQNKTEIRINQKMNQIKPCIFSGNDYYHRAMKMEFGDQGNMKQFKCEIR